MKRLHISDKLSLSPDYITGTAGMFATKGMGKSYLAQVIAEEMLAQDQPIVVVDPTDAWWGLRSSADGTGNGFPITIFGGRHADAKLETDGAIALADAVVKERFSCIIATKGMGAGAEIRFVREFLDRIYRTNQDSIHIFVDEADIFAPQKPFEVEDSRAIRTMSDIVRRGRHEGVGSTIITQRPSELNASVRSQVEMLFVLGMLNNLDIDAVEKWLRLRKKKTGDNVAFSLQEEMIESLDSMQQGDAWIWAPRQKIHQRFRARLKHTFDSGATPKPGQSRRIAKKLAPIDIARIGEAMAAAVQRKKEEDPATLRARIAELERARIPKVALAPPPMIVEKPMIAQKDLVRLGMAIDGARTYVAQLLAAAEKLEAITAPFLDKPKPIELPRELRQEAIRLHQQQRPKMALVRPASTAMASPTTVLDPDKLGRVHRAMLAALASYPNGLTRKKLRVHTGYADSGPTSKALTALMVAGYVEAYGQYNSMLAITPAGIKALGAFEPLPKGDALRASLLTGSRFSKAEKALFEVICAAWPRSLTRAEIRTQAGYADSGPTSKSMSKLVNFDYVEEVGRGGLRAVDELFSRAP